MAAVSAALISSCVRSESTGLNDGNKRYFDAWVKINHPDAVRDGLGVYVFDETVGSGQALGKAEDYPYIYIVSTTTDLDGNVTETSDALIAQQVGTYNDRNFYGPTVKYRSSSFLTAGQEMVISPMRVGGTRKAAIPGWLATAYRYDTEKEYLDRITGDDCIYSVKLVDVIKDIAKWQIDSISRYFASNWPEPVDSLKYGFYYVQTQAPTDTAAFPSGSSVYINYTGQLLNGKIFDTTVENIAKDAGLYSSSSEYSPMKVTLKDNYEDITHSTGEGEAGFVDGFSYCISRMRAGEKGFCVFYSELGYKGEGKGAIPAFSPLRFDMEMLGTDN